MCDDIRQVAALAANDNLSQLGTGPIYTGPDSAGHTGVDFPLSATQRVTFSLGGATMCGIDNLPQIGTYNYVCDFPTEPSLADANAALVNAVNACFPDVAGEQDSDGEGTNWSAQIGGKGIAINVWPISLNGDELRITISPRSDDDGGFGDF